MISEKIEVKIIGLNGCNCHPYESWEECKKMHNQKFKIGEKVKQRHTEEQGEIDEIRNGIEKCYVIVKYGELPRDRHLEHVANLIKLN